MFERIVIALDLTENVEKIAHILKDFGDERNRKVYLIHVVDMDSAGPMAGTLKTNDERALKTMGDVLAKKGFIVEMRVAIGNPAQEILAYVDEVNAKLIIVGAHSKGVASTVLLGSVSSDVINHSKTPVLVLKETPSK